MALSLGFGVAAHAAEPICLPGASATASVGHTDGDTDQVPADAETGYPHHHGSCHGHHVATPLDRAAQVPPLSAMAAYVGGTQAAVAAAPADPALRPPIT